MFKVRRNVQFLFLVCYLSTNSIFAVKDLPGNRTVGEFLNKQIEVINNATSELIVHDIITFINPVSLQCNKTNTDKIKIIRDNSDYLYLLSVDELLAIDVSDKKGVLLHFVGTLLQIDDFIEEVKIENWENSLIIVVRTANMLHIYLANNDFRGEAIDPIQKITMNSPSDRFVIFRKEAEVFLVTYIIKMSSDNELSYYRWRPSFFSKEYTESFDLPNKNNLFVYNQDSKDPLILAIGLGSSARVVIMSLNFETSRWTKLQSMHFKKDYIKHYVVDDKLYLIGCSTDAFCAVYKWDGAHFRRHQKLDNRVFEKIKDIHYKHDIVITESPQRKLSLFTDDDLASMKPGIVKSLKPEVNTYAIFKSRSDQKISYAEFIFNKTILEMNFYEMHIEKVHERAETEDSLLVDPIECVAKLKSILKSRMPKVQVSQLNAQKLLGQENKLQLDSKKHLKAKRASLKDTRVSRFKMPYKIKVNANALLESTASTNAQIEVTRISLLRSKLPKVDGRADEEEENEMDNIVVENLVYTGEEPIFSDLVLKSQPILIFQDDLRLHSLTTNKLVVLKNKINQIPLSQMINATSAKQISGIKIFKNLKVKNLTVAQTLNNVPLNFLDPSSDKNTLELADGFEFQGNINVKHLKVKSLNGFNVSSVLSNVFLAKDRNTIKGNLILQNVANIDSLVTGSLMEVPVENLMTKSTDQIVTADVFINKFFVRNLISDSINGEDLSENVALLNEKNVIEVPTQFMNIHIIKNLNIKDEADDDERAQADLTSTINNLKRHVIGTKTSDLSQIYNGKVVIQGSLTIQDVKFNSIKSKVFVSGIELPQNISANFWMKSVKQDIQVGRFTVNNQLKTENIVTHSLSELPIADLMMLDAKVPQGPVNLRFETATVEGDIKGHKDNIPSLIYHLNLTAVPRQGGFRLVQSSIDFRGKISVRKLETKFINHTPVSEFTHSGQQAVVFTAPKVLRSFQVKNIQVDEQLTANNFNNLDLQQFLSKAVRIDQPIELETLKLATFEAKTLVTKFFEDHLLNDFISSLQKEFRPSSDGSSSIMRNVRVIGNANFFSNILINTINSQTNFNELCNLLVLKNEPASSIGGTKVFQQSVIVTESVEAKLLNSFPLDRLMHHSLSRRGKQTITSEVFVKNLKVKSLKAKTLNNITYNQFIDKNMLELPLVVNLNVDELYVNHVISKSSSYDVRKMIELIRSPKRSYWNYVTVNGDSKIPLQSTTDLDLIASSAVLKKGPPQVITGNVQIYTSKLFIKHFTKSDNFIVSQLVPIDIQELFLDSLKSESSGKSQVIRGIKTFQSPIYAKDLKIEPQAYFESKKINNVDVLHLNRTIIRSFSDVVQSKKYFGEIHADQIIIEGKLNGIPWNSMAFVTKNDLKLPQLTIEHLEVFNLETQSLNDYWFSHFLVHRMRKHGDPDQQQQVEGLVTFTDLEFVNDTILSSINSVGIDDAVYSSSDQLQEVSGHKLVAGNINIVGPSTISAINGEDFGIFVRNSIWRTKDHTVRFMELPAIELKQGLLAKNMINGYRIDELLSSDTHTPKIDDLTDLIRQIRQQITELNSAKKAMTAKPKRLLYIDFDPTVQFEFEGARERSSENSCGKKVVEPAKYNAILVREKRDQNMTVELPSATIVTMPNFDCRNNIATSKEIFTMMTYKSRNLTVTEPFKFENFITDVKFLEPRKEIFMMILTMQGATDNKSEIFIEKLDETVQENWFEHQKISDLNFITKSKVIETSKNRFLVVSSFTDTTPATSDFVMILEHNPKTDKFVESQKKIPGEKFDIILGVNVAPKSSSMKPRSFLLLAKERSKVLYIYRLKEGSREFVFQRKISFDSEILEVVVLQITGDAPYFIVSQKSGEFCLFEWRGIESWKAKQCGHFMNINQIRSYEYLKRQHLFLTSTVNSGTALSVYRQGENF